MKVRMKVGVSGTRQGQEWPPRGSVIDLPDAEAADYCRAGMAEPIADFNDPETATPPEEPETSLPAPSEQAELPTPEKRGPITKARGPRPA